MRAGSIGKGDEEAGSVRTEMQNLTRTAGLEVSDDQEPPPYETCVGGLSAAGAAGPAAPACDCLVCAPVRAPEASMEVDGGDTEALDDQELPPYER